MNMECLVTGASRGIGWAIARTLAEAGHNVTLVATDKELLEKKHKELPTSKGQHHHIWIADFSDPEADLAPRGRVDIFVNAAGIAQEIPLTTVSVPKVNRVIQVNFTSAILLTRAIASGMIKEGTGGQIIHVTSVLGIKGVGSTSVYSATKAGLDGFVRSLARELGPSGIRVNSLAPALVDTDMGRAAPDIFLQDNIIPGLIPAESIASAVLFLIENKNVTGQTLRVDNGYTI